MPKPAFLMIFKGHVIFFRFALYFAAISRSAWAYLDCLSPIGVVYFIEAHPIDKIYVSTFTYFESTQQMFV